MLNKLLLDFVFQVKFPYFLLKVEKTRHYLLLREKLEATLHAGQDALYKNGDIIDFAKSPVLSHSPSSSPAPDSPNQRQRELAAKVTAAPLISILHLSLLEIYFLSIFTHSFIQLHAFKFFLYFSLSSVCDC